MTHGARCVVVLSAVLFALAPGRTRAETILVEDFEAEFPAWESGWLGVNSNLENNAGVGAGRGNNLDGLWLDDGDLLTGNDASIDIVFLSSFGATLTALSFDVAGYAPATLKIFDMSGAELLSEPFVNAGGVISQDPVEVYVNFSVTSTNGISGFTFLPADDNNPIEGNTSIDNVTATIPEPSAVLLGLIGLFGLLAVYSRHSRSQAPAWERSGHYR